MKKEIQLNFKDTNQSILMFSAFRYALGRQTYVVGSIVDIMIANWDNMLSKDKELYRKEIRDAINNNHAGMDMDVAEWNRILELEDCDKE